jgi:hypothetical protein
VLLGSVAMAAAAAAGGGAGVGVRARGVMVTTPLVTAGGQPGPPSAAGGNHTHNTHQ